MIEQIGKIIADTIEACNLTWTDNVFGIVNPLTYEKNGVTKTEAFICNDDQVECDPYVNKTVEPNTDYNSLIFIEKFQPEFVRDLSCDIFEYKAKIPVYVWVNKRQVEVVGAPSCADEYVFKQQLINCLNEFKHKSTEYPNFFELFFDSAQDGSVISNKYTFSKSQNHLLDQTNYEFVLNFEAVIRVNFSCLDLVIQEIPDCVGFEPEYQALLDKGTAEGFTLPNAAAQELGNNLVIALKAAGIWVKLDVLWVYATNGDSDFATLNWINPANHQAVKVNAPLFTSKEGFTGDGVSSYLDLNWDASIDGVNYIQNNASVVSFVRARGTASPRFDIGASDGTIITLLESRGTFTRINQNPSFAYVHPNAPFFIGVNRPDAATANAYGDGLLLNSVAQASNGLPPFDFYSLAVNNNGVVGFFSDAQKSMDAMGADLTAEQPAFNAAYQTYQAAIELL